jgi:hypothetical protein
MSDCHENEGNAMNRKALLTGFAIVALGLIVAGVGLTCLQQAAPGTPIIDIPSIPNIIGSSGPYILAAPFPVVNDSYPIYRTVLPDDSTEEIRRIADRFGVSGEIGSMPSNGKIRLVDRSKDPAAEFTIYTNCGAVYYSIPAKVYPKYPNTEANIPSDDEARAIATNRLKELGLLPDDVHFEDVVVGDKMGITDKTSRTEYILTKYVTFFKKIQGLRVYGAGVGVTINDKGEVVRVGSSLREYDPKPIRYVKIVTPEQAYQRLNSGDLMVQPLPENYKKIAVTNISLGYWMDIPSNPQKYIVPVYVFSCDASWDGNTEQVIRYVPAVDPSEVQDLT